MTGRLPLDRVKIWNGMNVGGLGIPLGFFAAILFTYDWSDNPLLWRVFSPKDNFFGPGNHHTLIMLLFGVTFLIMLRAQVAPFFATFGLYLAVQSYEAEWYVTYTIVHVVNHIFFQWKWIEAGIITLPVMFWYTWRFGLPLKYLVWMVPVFAVWGYFGFPITEDFPAFTPLYGVPWVNALEIWSHVWAIAGFVLFEIPILRKATLQAPTPEVINSLSKKWKTVMERLRKRRSGIHVVKVAVELIIWASIGLTALILLSTSSTTGITGPVNFLAVTFVAIMAVIGVAIAFIPSAAMGGGMIYRGTAASDNHRGWGNFIKPTMRQVLRG